MESNSNTKLTRIIKIASLYFCLIGMVIQNVFVTIEYFKYATTTEVLMGIESEFTPPAFSFCSPLEALRKPNSNICLNQSRRACSDWMMFNNTVHKLMQNLTINLPETVEEINTLGKKIPKDQHYKHLDEFYSDSMKCLRVRFSPESPDITINNSFISKLSAEDLSYFYMVGHGNYTYLYNRTGWIFFSHAFHDPETYLRAFEIKTNDERIGIDRTDRYYSYVKFHFHYLPPPFSTMCRKYDRKIIDSREHCIEKCIKSSTRKVFGQNIASNRLVLTSMEWETNPSLSFDQIANTNITHHYTSCQSFCPLECTSNYYETDLIFAQPTRPRYSYGYNILNWNVARKMVYSPKLDILSYMIYIASVCSLWLGFVILDSLILLATSVVNQFKFKQQTTNNNNIIHPLMNVAQIGVINNVVNVSNAERVFSNRNLAPDLNDL